MSAGLAALPIVVILVLMLGMRWPASRAGLAGLAVALLLALGPFREGYTADVGPLAATGGAMAEAIFTSITILWIIVPALALHQMQSTSGALEAIEGSLGRLTGDPRVLALLVAWFFALFMEGAAGFGTSAALAAPFLVATGFSPIQAVIMAMVGHAAGVSFGAVGTPILPQVAATGFSALELARATAPYHAILGAGLAALVVIIARRARTTGDMTRTAVPATATAALFFLGPYLAIAWFLGPELPTLGGALIGGLAFVPLVRRFRPIADEPPEADLPGPVWTAAPYLGVVGLVLATRLPPRVSDTLSGLEWTWRLQGGFAGSFAPLYHPGSMVVGGLLLGWALQRLPHSNLTEAVRKAIQQVGTVTVALVAMLGLSRVMVHSGMIDALAGATADLAGAGWPLLAPVVGALGTFVTGSATTSNILFTDFQNTTANTLALPPLPLIGAQGFGAAAGNMICPHNVIAANAVVEQTGKEGEVLATTLWITAAYLAAGGVVAFGLVLVGS